MKYLLAATLIFFSNLQAQEPASKKASGKVRSYLHEILSIIQQNAICADSIDWKILTAKVDFLSAGIKRREDCRPVIDTIFNALKKAGDRHSGFLNKEEQKKYSSPAKQSPPEGNYLGAKTGYIKVPGIMSFSLEQSRAFATAIEQLIRQIDSANNIEFWIVDLRQNTGGDLNPMAMGLRPLLGDGVVAYGINPRRNAKIPLSTTNGQVAQVDPGIHYKLRTTPRRMAILIGPKTGSSGEWTGIAFKSLPNTRFFGLPTAGATTGCTNFPLSNGDLLYIATTFMADRTGQTYLPRIFPDVVIDTTKTDKNDAVIEAARLWFGDE
jgi:carboxyl-terminal processing protease